MSSRSKSRELCLQMLYQWEVGGHTPTVILDSFFTGKNLDNDVKQYARELFEGSVREVKDLDQLIRNHAEHWRLERMAVVDRNILRLSLYELIRFPDLPHAVVINEALELARRFSGAESVQFVNGILDAVRKARAAGQRP